MWNSSFKSNLVSWLKKSLFACGMYLGTSRLSGDFDDIFICIFLAKRWEN